MENVATRKSNREILGNLYPSILWKHFGDISEICRPTYQENQMVGMIVRHAQETGCEVIHRDDSNNLLIRIPASKGRENDPVIVVQSHSDMIITKPDSMELTDMFPLKLRVGEDNWLRATDTTLGADNGIGLAAIMALMSDRSLQHGPLEAYITAAEETGLIGAKKFDYRYLQGKKIINLDYEDSGIFCVGCAGGKTMEGTFEPVYFNPDHQRGTYYSITITGKGGHSGTDIDLGFANTLSILTDLLFRLVGQYQLASMQGGTVSNAIPGSSSAVIFVPDTTHSDQLKGSIGEYVATYAEGMIPQYPNDKLMISIDECAPVQSLMNVKSSGELLQLLMELPNGVISRQEEDATQIRTSSNLAMVTPLEAGSLEIIVSVRSSSEDDIEDLENKIQETFKLHGGSVSVVNDSVYPSWEPKYDSPFLSSAVAAYTALFNEPPKKKVVHAGLECGVFAERIEGVDIISFGPTIKGAHGKDERVDIASVGKFWELLCAILAL